MQSIAFLDGALVELYERQEIAFRYCSCSLNSQLNPAEINFCAQTKYWYR